MRSRYRKTIAGFVWVVSSPILTFLTQSLIFKEIFKFNINHYSVYLLAGLLPWFFISQTLHSTTSCLVLSREVLLAFKIAPLKIVSSQVLDQFISFVAAFCIVGTLLILPHFGDFGFIRLCSIVINLTLILYLMLVLTNLLAFWHVFYRDISFIVQFLIGLAFYLTPVFFTIDMFPEKYVWMLKLNFFIPFIQMFQSSLYEWNFETWRIIFFKAIIINLSLTMILKLSLKYKMRDFYINV
jgi:ABC-type polysaccharide/polyol phosphate export permease